MKKSFYFRAALALSLFFVFSLSEAEGKEALKGLRESFARAAVVSYAPDATVTDRYIRYSDEGRANDVLLLQLYMSVHLPDAELERLISLLDDKAYWTDIDYNDKTRGRWQPTLHLTRLYAMTKLYADPSSPHYKAPELGSVIHRCMASWLAVRPECPNWWHNEIGVPKKFASVMLMIYDELTPEEMQGGLELLERSTFKMTGQNKAWLAGNLLMKGMLTDDAALVQKSRDVIAEEIGTSTKEGIQPDWSFHQHGPQIQFGNYGLTYAESLSFWFRVLENSPYAYSQEQFDILSNLISEGISWSVWKGVMDPSYCGRQNFMDAGTGKAYSMAVAMQNLAATSYKGSEKYNIMSLENLLPEQYENTLTGPRYFRRSDCGVYRTKDWYASIRMHSERTVGYELTNRENRLSNFSADGAMLFMETGDEYHNIFAHWDWYRLPGVTAFENGRPMKCTDDVKLKRNYSKWCGGVAGSDALAASVELNRDGLHALKSNFFFDEFTVSLGCDINISDPECTALFTGINQNHLDGEVLVGRGDALLQRIPADRPVDLKFAAGEASWLHHDNFGYVLLADADLSVSTLNQSGKWDYMDPFYVDCVQEGRVFKTWVNHDRSAKDNAYAYAVLPCSSVEQTKAFAKAPSVTVLRNDAACQAVACDGTVGAVFHKAGSVETPQGVLSVDAPALVLVEDGVLYLSSPCPESSSLNLSLTGGSIEIRECCTLPMDAADCGKTIVISGK